MRIQVEPDELRELAKKYELRRLKPRDFPIIALALRGLTSRQIANELGLHPQTVTVILRKHDARQLMRVVQLQPYQSLATSSESVVQALAHQALFDPGMFVGVKSPADLNELIPERDRRLLVKGWRYDQKGNFIIDFVDKEKALDRLAQYHGVYRATSTSLEDYTTALERALERHERRRSRMIDRGRVDNALDLELEPEPGSEPQPA
jgi:hypothetical protein